MELDIKNEIDLMKSTNVLRGKMKAMQEIKQRFAPIFMLPAGTVSKKSFDSVMDSYHYGLTKEMENIQARQEILSQAGHGK